MITRLLCTAALLTASAIAAWAHDHVAQDDKSRVTLVYDHVLPNVPGKSANASTTERARLLAVFVVDTEETVLTTPETR